MNFLKRLWRYRFIRILAWFFGTVLTLYVLFFAWVNYTGAKQWTATQAMLHREGETLDFRALVTDPVPEEKNYCAIPALKDLSLVVDHDATKGEPGEKRKRLDDVRTPVDKGPRPIPSPRKGAGAALGTPLDLKAWADWMRKDGSLTVPNSGNAARDVLAALSKHDALFTELATGLNRPEAHWTPEWKTRELPDMLFAVAIPHYASAQGLVYTLALRATAAARAGDAKTAHESLLISLSLTRACLNDPFLIGELVACSQSTLIDSALWEICDAHVGTAEDFRRLQEELAKLNFEKALLQSFREEMAAGVDTVLWMKRRANPQDLDMLYFVSPMELRSKPNFMGRLAFKTVPGGLFHLNAATMADMEFNYLIKPVRDGGLRGALDQGAVLEELVKNIPKYRVDKIFARLAVPAINNVIVRTAYVQCLNNQAIAACALERWFIEHHEYPDSLAVLGPVIPTDPLTGKPMGYRKTPDGKYALWCSGVDGKDDGGTRQLKADRPEYTKFADRAYKGDWVWSYQP